MPDEATPPAPISGLEAYILAVAVRDGVRSGSGVLAQEGARRSRPCFDESLKLAVLGHGRLSNIQLVRSGIRPSNPRTS